jgi:hypothetical protein
MVAEFGAFIKRLQDEINDLEYRCIKLQNFIVSEDFASVDIRQQSLLRIQVSAMETYLRCLSERLVLLQAKL